MGSYDGAEICELIGTFMLSLIGNKYNPNNIGVYRDDGLAVFKNTSGSQFKKLKRLFKKCLKTKVLQNTPSKNAKQCNCQLKENCPIKGACLKESLVCYATISCNDKNYKPKLYNAKQVLRNAVVITKNHLTYHCINMTPSYQQNTGT